MLEETEQALFFRNLNSLNIHVLNDVKNILFHIYFPYENLNNIYQNTNPFFRTWSDNK